MVRGPGLVTVSGGGAVGVFVVASGVTATLSGLTISGGSTTGNGGGVLADGPITLTGCILDGNSSLQRGRRPLRRRPGDHHQLHFFR